MKHRLKLNLQLFAEGESIDPGVESAPAAEVQETEVTDSNPGVESQAAAEPEKQNNFEKAFAKRLADAQAKWEADKQAELQKMQEQYKDYDVLKKATEYLQKTSGIQDLMSLKEQLELTELQERADRENVPPDVLKRIDELEVKAAKAEEYEKQQQEAQTIQQFESSLKTFCEGKEIDGKPLSHQELWQYMHENEISKPESAFKAMKADILEAKLETAKQDAVKEYLESKKAPKVEGSGSPGQQHVDTSKLGWGDVTKAAIARMQSALTRE